MIPGYGNTNHDDYTNLYKKVQTLEKGMEAQTLYISKMQSLINGEIIMDDPKDMLIDSMVKPFNSDPVLKSKEEIALEDEQLLERQISM
ncbi:MAG: hypothetical protein IPF93_14925 [Saprospiraceae bacterium]|nr:hypothetical protein [Saprospiraceae bacterium]